MATEALFYLDAGSLDQATSVYTDIGLTTLAADGFYSNTAISREQLNGVLQAATTCANCASPPPATATLYVVTQTVDNDIVGTLGVNYTLSGSGYDGSGAPGPVTLTGPAQTPYNFVIVATPASGFEFAPNPNQYSATNPSGLIPPNPSGTTVENKLTGTIQPIPTSIPTLYYKLNGCSAADGTTPVGGWILRTITNKPTTNQRFVTTNTTPEEYYTYDSTISGQAIIPVSDRLEDSGGRNLTLNLLAGETGCPSFNVTTELVIQLTRCSDASSDFYFRTQRTNYQGYTRITNDGGSTIYTLNQNLLPPSQLIGKTELFNLELIDVNGVLEGQPGYTGVIVGCPTDTYWILSACDPSGQPTNNLRVSSNPVNDPVFNTGGANSVYRDDGATPNGAVCWELVNQTNNPSQYITNTTPALNLVIYVGPDCQACTLQGPGPGGGSSIV